MTTPRIAATIKGDDFMLMVISPPRLLDYETPPATQRFTQPQYLDHSQELIQQLRELTPAQNQRVDARFRQNRRAQRRPLWQLDTRLYPGQRQAGFAGLQRRRLHRAQCTNLQRSRLRLRPATSTHAFRPVWPAAPLDLMQPYRLEMGTKLANARGKDLYAFWGTRISEWLNEALADQGDDVLLNLASNEYFSAVKRSALKARIINTDFKDLKNGQYKIISFYAKKARGMMSRFIIEERINDPARLERV